MKLKYHAFNEHFWRSFPRDLVCLSPANSLSAKINWNQLELLFSDNRLDKERAFQGEH